jgi:hypothetical protein
MCGGGGFLDDVVNTLTGGISNALGGTDSQYGGTLAWLTGLGNASNAAHEYNKHGGDIATFWDSAIDLPDPLNRNNSHGLIDSGFREMGNQWPEWAQKIAPTVGTTIGGIVGSYIPVIGNAAGAAGGRMIGGKFAGEDYKSGAIGGSTVLATAGVGKMAGQYIGGLNSLDSFGNSMALAGGAEGVPPSSYLTGWKAANGVGTGLAENAGRMAVPYEQWTGKGGEAAINNSGQGLVYGSPDYLSAAQTVGVSPDIGLMDYWNSIPQSVKEIGKEVLQKSGKLAFDNFMASMAGKPPQSFVPQEAPHARYLGRSFRYTSIKYLRHFRTNFT